MTRSASGCQAVLRSSLSAELTLSPRYSAAWGKLKDDSGLALRFPRFTGRWRDDKAPEDATTTDERSAAAVAQAGQGALSALAGCLCRGSPGRRRRWRWPPRRSPPRAG